MSIYLDISEVDETVTDVAAIKQSIRNIILTPKGSLPGKPKFGSDIYKVIFAPLDSLTKSMAKNYIKEALNEYETRITVSSINLTSVEEYNKLVIEVVFTYDGGITTDGDQIDSTSISISV